MPLFTKRKTNLQIQLTNSDQATCHGGQLLVDALCRRFDLWKRLQNEPSLDPRRRTGAGFTPCANVAQVLFTLTTLWYGPWLLDGILDGAGDVSQHLPVLLDEHQQRWHGRPSYLYADSASSAGKFLNRIEQGAFSRWSVSYNKWTDILDRLGAELADSQWSALPQANQPQEQYAWVKHQPGEREQVQKFATVRWKKDGDLMWRYAYVACKPGEKDSPQAVFERHRLKGAKEQGFSQLLSGLDLHHPPCMGLVANQAFYAIAMLAYNVLISLKVLDLPDEAQGWRIQTIIRHLLTVPVSVSKHARYEVARICIPAGWLRWWHLFVGEWFPKRKAGRPVLEEVDSA